MPPGGFKPPQEVIEGILRVVAFSRSSEEAGPFPFDHSRYPVAAAHIVKGDDHLYMVIVDAETDPRYQLMATLHKTGAATEKELSTFSDLLESLVFDPELVCPTGNTG